MITITFGAFIRLLMVYSLVALLEKELLPPPIFVGPLCDSHLHAPATKLPAADRLHLRGDVPNAICGVRNTCLSVRLRTRWGNAYHRESRWSYRAFWPHSPAYRRAYRRRGVCPLRL